MISAGDPNNAAISAGLMKMPAPITDPITRDRTVLKPMVFGSVWII
jgi:hypothetical protein